jgi:hypothetical protein
LGAQAIGDLLQNFRVRYGEKGIVGIMKGNPKFIEFLAQVGMAIEIVGGLKRNIRKPPASPSVPTPHLEYKSSNG